MQEGDAAFDVVPIPIGEYAHHESVPADEEAAGVLELLGRLGGRGLPWPIDAAERHQTSVAERLAAWSSFEGYGLRACRSSVLYWVGHGASDGDDAWLATFRTTARMGGTAMRPDALADHIMEEWRSRAEAWAGQDDPDAEHHPDADHDADGEPWALVVIEACGAARFVERLGAALFTRPDPPRRLALIGIGGYGTAFLGEFRTALRLTVESYTDNDESIRLRDLIGRLQERLPSSTVIEFPELHRARPIRHNRVLASVAAPLDVYQQLRAFVAALPADQRGHFIPSALGAEQGELAWYFVGRKAELDTIAAWLNGAAQGMFVVTGPPGVGKSALLGNLVLQSDYELRTLISRAAQESGGPAPATANVLAAGTFDAVVHLTGLTVAGVVDRIATAVGEPSASVSTDPREAAERLIRRLQERSAQVGGSGGGGPRPLTVLVDALDEAQEPLAVAASLLRPLAAVPGCRVVVGTRASTREGPDRPAPPDQDLLDALGTSARTPVLDVSQDPDSVADFVRRRLSAARDQAKLEVSDDRIEQIADRVRVNASSFLFARLLIHEITARPELVEQRNSDRLLALSDSSYLALFAAAVDRLTAGSPKAAGLLSALALSQGRGLPRADRIWAAAGGALGATVVTEADIDVLLDNAAPYIMLDGEDGGSVYRLAHRTFQEYFAATLPAPVPSNPQDAHAAIATALAALARASRPRQPGAYIVRHLTAHVAISDEWPLLSRDTRLLDALDPDAVAADMLRAKFGAARVSDEVAAVLSARHLLRTLPVAQRALVREIAQARLSGDTTRGAALRWACLRSEPLHLVMTGHVGAVLALAVVPLPDGRTLLASAGADGTVRLFDTATGWSVGEPLTGHAGAVSALAPLSPGSNGGRAHLASAGVDGTIRLWDCVTGRQLGAPLREHTAAIRTLVTDGSWLASADDHTVRLWTNPEQYREGQSVTRESETVDALAMVPNLGRGVLAAVVGGRRIKLWELRTLRPHGDLAHSSLTALTRIAKVDAADGSCAVVVASARKMWLLDPTAAEATSEAQPLDPGAVSALAQVQDPDRTLLAIAGVHAAIRLWDASADHAVGAPLTGHSGPVRALAAVSVGADRSLLASAGEDGTVRLWDARPRGSGEPSAARLGHEDWVGAVAARAMLPTGRTVLATASDDGTARLWDADTGELLQKLLLGHSDWVRAVTFGRSCATVWTCGWDGAIRQWDGETGVQTGGVRLSGSDRLEAMAAIPDGTGGDGEIVAVGGSGRTIRLWEPGSTQTSRAALSGHTGTIRALASLGADRLASAADDGTIRLWDPRVPSCSAVLRGHRGPVNALTMVPGDGGLLASAGHDRTLRLWDPVTRRCELTIPFAHKGAVSALCVLGEPADTDGAPLLVSAGEDATLRLWHAASGRLLGTAVLGVSVRGIAPVGARGVAVAAEAGVLVIDL
ncbi:AAA family ATPase [Actinospica robiniae]|uniref:AAA family ATPase n=1 Tax=Actinospica robiniae TaxID=304901 RepID=UPI0004284BD9|nr:AAA family ATPase [Actinospica robiniae]